MVILYNAAEKAKAVKNMKELKLLWPQNNRLIAVRIITIMMEMQGGGVFLSKLKEQEREMHGCVKSPLPRWHFNNWYLIKMKN